ncbi:hypothetical protein RCL1_007274 [Eukaryota sp. TZLM3-RCL]
MGACCCLPLARTEKVALSPPRNLPKLSSSSDEPSTPVPRLSLLPARFTPVLTRSPRETQVVYQHKDSEGRTMVNQYRLDQVLGKGSYGRVYKALDTNTGEFVAIKVFTKSFLRKKRLGSFNSEETALSNVRTEIAILKKLNHPHVMSLYEVIDHPSADKIFIVMELADRPLMPESLAIRPIDINTTWALFRDLIRGLEYLHANGVIHRDIKPSNCLVDSKGRLKISDFGVALMTEKACNDLVKFSAGSPAFTPPELITSNRVYSGKMSDVWAVGITLYMMVFGKLPFDSNSIVDLFNSILSCDLVFPSDTDPLLVDLLRKLLAKDPTQRITIDSLKKHPWVTDEGNAEMEDLEAINRVILEAEDFVTAVNGVEYRYRSPFFENEKRGNISLLVGSLEKTRRLSLVPTSAEPTLKPIVETKCISRPCSADFQSSFALSIPIPIIPEETSTISDVVFSNGELSRRSDDMVIEETCSYEVENASTFDSFDSLSDSSDFDD